MRWNNSASSWLIQKLPSLDPPDACPILVICR
jgi:hypothetical protein